MFVKLIYAKSSILIIIGDVYIDRLDMINCPVYLYITKSRLSGCFYNLSFVLNAMLVDYVILLWVGRDCPSHLQFPSGHLVPNWRRINVDAMWWRHIDVDTMSFWHQMPTGWYRLSIINEVRKNEIELCWNPLSTNIIIQGGNTVSHYSSLLFFTLKVVWFILSDNDYTLTLLIHISCHCICIYVRL